MDEKFSLKECWHPIGVSAEVGDAPKRFELLNIPVVAFRIGDELRAYRDLCIHRGTALSNGWVEQGEIVCPYHGWRYDGSGRCTHIPSLSQEKPIPAGAQVDAFPVMEEFGLVWVALEQPKLPFPHWFGGTWDDPNFRVVQGVCYEWQASAARAVENFMDMSHFAFVHEGILGSRDYAEAPEHVVFETEVGFGYEFDAPEPNDFHSSGDDIVHWEYELIAPFTVHLSKTLEDGRITLISLVASPRGPARTGMYVYVGRNYDLDPALDDDFISFTDTIMRQDQVIVESQRPQEIPIDLREEMHLKIPDASGISYRKLLSQFAEKDEYFLV